MPDSVASPPDSSPLPGRYRHYKGHDYYVLGMTRHSETEEWLVLYQALYGECGFWSRPLALWNSTAEQHGETVVRFSPQALDAERSLNGLSRLGKG